MSYQDLKVWQKSVALAKFVYEVTKLFPADEKFGLIQQIRRCTVSVASNISEGSSRNTNKEFANFLVIARGSLAELHTQAIIASEVRFLDDISKKRLEKEIEDIGKMINGLRKSLTSVKSQGASN